MIRRAEYLRRARLLAIAVGMVALGGCSLITFEDAACSDDSECIGEFGEGSTCDSGGFCTIPAAAAECTNSQECVATGGFGSICDQVTTTCRDLRADEIEPRCVNTEPADLLTNLDAYRDRIVFLTAHDTTASSGHLGRESAVLAAIRYINEATVFQDLNGVGRQFGLIMCDEYAHADGDEKDYPSDELGRSDAAVAVAKWGVEVLGVPGIIGPAGSSDTIRAFNEVIVPSEGRAIQVANGAASPAITTVDAVLNPEPNDSNPGWLWRTSSSGEGQGVVLANDLFNRDELNGQPLRAQNIRTAALIHEKGAFGSGIADAFQEEYLRITGRSASDATPIRVSYTDGDIENLKAETDKVRDQLAGVDAIFFGGQVRDHNEFMKHISQDGSPWLAREDLPIYFPQTAIGPSVFKDAVNSALFDQVIAANPSVAVDSSAYAIFRSEFITVDPLKREPEGVSQTAQSWDAGWLLAAGSMWAAINEGTVTGISIARGIRRLTPLTLPANPSDDAIQDVQFDSSDWAIMASVFRSGADARVDARGATGELSYDLGDTEEKPTELTILKSPDTTGETNFEPIAQCDESLICTPTE